MIDGFTTWQKIRLWLSDYKFMQKPLAQVERFFDDYIVYLRYIFALFVLTLMFILLRLLFKWASGWRHATFFRSAPPGIEADFWERFQMEDEKRSLKELKEIFEEERRSAQAQKRKASGPEYTPIGSVLLQQIITAVNQGLADSEIIKILPSNVSLIDVLPIVDAIRSFRDLAARKILDPKSREKRDYARALKEMSQGRPDRASRLMKKELVRQQQVLFGLKDKLLQQYARKEAAQLALHLGLILGMYDTQLADKAFRRAMELNPKDSKGLILFGRFRQKTAGQQDKVMEKTFLKLAKGIDRTLQNYMLNYAVEMVRKSEIRSRQEEIRNRIQDEKERYNEAVNVERLKVREALKLARMRDIAEEVRVR